MKLPIVCSKCMDQNPGAAVPLALVEFQDSGRYQTTCPNGHISITVLQEQKFELLFDIGAYAIADGYYREAISSFTSSLERFYEFFISVVLFERGIDEELFNKSWKFVAAQSERQLGAFIFLYVSEFKKLPNTLSQDSTKFRNSVIHKGYIPSKKEAIEYGEEVLKIIRLLVREAKEKYPKGIHAAMVRHLRAHHTNPKDFAATMTIPTIIGLNRDDKAYQERSLEEAIAQLKRY